MYISEAKIRKNLNKWQCKMFIKLTIIRAKVDWFIKAQSQKIL